ncbi:MAG: TIGR04053 family radical SAM/SPASM domain-containing protein [Desulfurococcales archaeon]|nr:TIGR04053 family radical SAM/SPASM domain-containing protein [Desulfurococcales archaeon]
MIKGKWPFDKKPLLIFWETTKACQLVCKHCRANAITHPLPGELSTREAFKLLDEIANFGKPSPILVFTGGDPLMRRDFWTLVNYARGLGLRMAVAPSVTPLLTRGIMFKFKSEGISAISISIDSFRREVHDTIRGIPGTFDRSLKALEWAKEAGLRVQVNTVVMRETVSDLPGMVKLLLEKGIRVWEVFYYVPTGRGGKESDLTPREWEDVSHFLYEASRYGIMIRTVEGPFFRRVALTRRYYEKKQLLYKLDEELGELYHMLMSELRSLLGEPVGEARAHTVGTMDARGIVFVSYDGNVYPSGFLPLSAGNVKEQSIVEIYRRSRLFSRLRDELRGRCGRCEFRSICGGSRARAYAITGDPYAEDPACMYEPGSLPREVIENIAVSR